MKIYISTFYSVRFFKPNMIPISTTTGWPYWIYKHNGQPRDSYFVDKNNVMNGISEETLCFPKEKFLELHEQCSKDCLYKNKVPNCEFMIKYYEHLKNDLNFDYIINECNRVAEDVRKVTKFEGEPIVVLLVYESPSCNCAERPIIIKWFKENGYNLEELPKSLLI